MIKIVFVFASVATVLAQRDGGKSETQYETDPYLTPAPKPYEADQYLTPAPKTYETDPYLTPAPKTYETDPYAPTKQYETDPYASPAPKQYESDPYAPTNEYEAEPYTTLSSIDKPCGSEHFHRKGKCGGANHGFLRCPEGMYCSQYGLCGTSVLYQVDAICDKEERKDPDIKVYRKSPDDKKTFWEKMFPCFYGSSHCKND